MRLDHIGQNARPQLVDRVFINAFAHERAGAPSDLVLVSACGAVGGLIYWLIAGRSAGIVPRPSGADVAPNDP